MTARENDLKLPLDHLLSDLNELVARTMEQLALEEARLLAQRCRQYSQPHRLAQSEISTTANSPDPRHEDTEAFRSFGLTVDDGVQRDRGDVSWSFCARSSNR